MIPPRPKTAQVVNPEVRCFSKALSFNLEMKLNPNQGLLPTEWVESASNMLQVLFYQGLATYGSL